MAVSINGDTFLFSHFAVINKQGGAYDKIIIVFCSTPEVYYDVKSFSKIFSKKNCSFY